MPARNPLDECVPRQRSRHSVMLTNKLYDIPRKTRFKAPLNGAIRSKSPFIEAIRSAIVGIAMRKCQNDYDPRPFVTIVTRSQSLTACRVSPRVSGDPR